MHFSQAFILAALPFLATATTPLKHRQSNPTYSLLSIHSGDQAVQNQPIVASDEYFYLSKDSSATCSSTDTQSHCNAQTQISIQDSAVDLNVQVPGGQQVFVDNTGALSYTPPHSHLIPAGASSTGFQALSDSSDGSPAVFNLAFGGKIGASGWLACPLSEDNANYYQVFANITGVQVSGTSVSHCHDIAIALVPVPAKNTTQMVYQFN